MELCPHGRSAPAHGAAVAHLLDRGELVVEPVAGALSRAVGALLLALLGAALEHLIQVAVADLHVMTR